MLVNRQCENGLCLGFTYREVTLFIAEILAGFLEMQRHGIMYFGVNPIFKPMLIQFVPVFGLDDIGVEDLPDVGLPGRHGDVVAECRQALIVYSGMFDTSICN